MGLYLSGHPIDRYADELAQFIPKKIADLDAPEAKGYQRNEVPLLTAGLIVAIRTMKSKNGSRMAFVTLDDQTARLEIRVFSDVYEQYQGVLQPDKLVVIQGKIGQDNFTGGLAGTAESVYDLPKARELYGKALRLTVTQNGAASKWINQFQSVMMPFCGGVVPVELTYRNTDAEVLIQLGHDWQITPTDTLLKELAELPGSEMVMVRY